MDNLFLSAAFVVLVFGIWIGRSGLRRLRQRKGPMTAQVAAETSPLTDFHWRPHFEAGVGALMILWALRIFILFAVQVFSARAVPYRQDSVTGRVEPLPTTAAGVTAINDALQKSSSSVIATPK